MYREKESNMYIPKISRCVLNRYECRLFTRKSYLQHLYQMIQCTNASINKNEFNIYRDGDNDKRNNSGESLICILEI